MSSNSPELEDVLLFDPPFIDPGQPTGFWFCADPEDVLAVQVNAGCIRSDAGWEAWAGLRPSSSGFVTWWWCAPTRTDGR